MIFVANILFSISSRVASVEARSCQPRGRAMSEQPSDTSRERIDEVRRAAIIRMGRYAAYTAPAMTSLLIAERAMATTSVDGGGGWHKRGGRPRGRHH